MGIYLGQPSESAKRGDRSGMGASTDQALAFETRGLTKVYRTGDVEVHALRGVDLTIDEGAFTVLLGASGSGKSTLVNILGGLDRGTEGEVFFRGERITRASDRELTRFRRAHIGFVFQFYNLMPSLTARENIELVTEIAENPMAPEKALGLVQLSDRMDHFPAQLSGGQQQRVAIARAIAKQPDVLLCDEPTGALDSETGVLVLDTLRAANETLGTTTVVITHNAAVAEMADQVIQLADGQVREERYNSVKKLPQDIVW